MSESGWSLDSPQYVDGMVGTSCDSMRHPLKRVIWSLEIPLQSATYRVPRRRKLIYVLNWYEFIKLYFVYWYLVDSKRYTGGIPRLKYSRVLIVRWQIK